MTTTEPRPALKSLTHTPDQPSPAQPAGASTGRSAPKVAARQGAPSALGPDPHAAGKPRVIGWLHVICPDDWRAPVRATSHCDCGRHATADTRADVIALVKAHVDHRTRCPLHNTPERRKAP
jgi:hypothetical protein